MPNDVLLMLSHKNTHNGSDAAAGEDEEGGAGGGGGDDDASDEEVEEVSGYHFMDCVPLFISYIYVTSGKNYTLTAHVYNLIILSRTPKTIT